MGALSNDTELNTLARTLGESANVLQRWPLEARKVMVALSEVEIREQLWQFMEQGTQSLIEMDMQD